jgi:hypothetical protein
VETNTSNKESFCYLPGRGVIEKKMQNKTLTRNNLCHQKLFKVIVCSDWPRCSECCCDSTADSFRKMWHIVAVAEVAPRWTFPFEPPWCDVRRRIRILEGTSAFPFGILVRGRVLNRRQRVYVSVSVFVIDSRRVVDGGDV